MAIYHLSVSNVSRASGSRATATLSYITGKRVHDERRGETYDYGRKERVLRVGTLLPEGAPAEFADPAVLFNAVELHETGRTARPAKKIVVALPREFTPRQRVQALEEYIRENLNADGYAATYAIHEDREGNNPHAHILVANRQIDPATGGWARLKQRMEYVLDERGERSMAELWREALEQVPLGLDGPGRLALEELGEVLGRYDGDGQREALAHTRAELSRALEQAREAREKQGRMYQVLGITAGAFLVILLL